MSNDAIVLLKEDHKTVKQLFREIEKRKEDGGEAIADLAKQVCLELLVHAQVEEEIFYPLARQSLDDELMILEADEEHHIAELLVQEIIALEPTDEHYVAKCIVLKEMVEHHIEEEETEMFPKMREELGRAQLQEIGEQMLARKEQLTKELQLT